MSRHKPDKWITIVCEECGSDNVCRDASAMWSVEHQQWELSGVQDQGYCMECDIGEVTLVEVEIPDPTKAGAL